MQHAECYFELVHCCPLPTVGGLYCHLCKGREFHYGHLLFWEAPYQKQTVNSRGWFLQNQAFWTRTLMFDSKQLIKRRFLARLRNSAILRHYRTITLALAFDRLYAWRRPDTSTGACSGPSTAHRLSRRVCGWSQKFLPCSRRG